VLPDLLFDDELLPHAVRRGFALAEDAP
jgi:hypothetical protein